MPLATVLSSETNTQELERQTPQLLKALAAPPEDLSKPPRTHIRQLTTPCNSSSQWSNTLFWLQQATAHMCGYTHRRTDILISKN